MPLFDANSIPTIRNAPGAAQRFFTRALAVVGHAPEKVTTDGHDAYPRAIRETLGSEVTHRTSRYMNNRLEQDHRAIKQRYYPMRGFGSFDAAARFCTAHDELRDHFRYRRQLPRFSPKRPGIDLERAGV